MSEKAVKEKLWKSFKKKQPGDLLLKTFKNETE